MSQRQFADSMKSASIAKGIGNQTPLSDSQVRLLRGINGSLNWLSSQSRPDLAVQTSLSQQCFPQPTIRHLRDANNAIRRAKQHKDLCIYFAPVPLEQLTICCHSDAAFANVGAHTQAGFAIAFCDRLLNEGHASSWTPAVWKSYKLSRAVSSTLGGEAQAMSAASGTVEWMCLLLAETLDGCFHPRETRESQHLQFS